MNTQWLLQSNHPNLSAIGEIEAILLDLGCDVHSVALKGHSSDLPYLDMLDRSRPVVCYGPSFVPRALGHPDLSPGIFFDPATFRWSAFQDGWAELMISSSATVVGAAEAAGVIARGSMFVRPDEDSKAFDGGLFDAATMQDVIGTALSKGRLAPDTPVVVAAPVQIDAEWRTFIVGGEVVAASSYRKDGAGNIDLHVPHSVIDLAFDAADRWRPADVFCLDIAASGNRYGIVEANCFNASRFYGADATMILQSVSEFVSSPNAAMEAGEPSNAPDGRR